MSMKVSLNDIRNIFDQADLNRDGKLNDKEIATAVVMANSSDKSSSKELTSFFGTLIKGGKDKTGLKPDLDKDGQVSFREISMLARKAGDRSTVEVDDFKSMF